MILGITKRQALMLLVLITGSFITILNQTLLSPALPTIMKELSVDASTVQWLTTGFTLVNAIMIPITGYLTDRYSIRGIFVVAMSLFTAGTLLTAWAPTFTVLLAGRLVQACGAGMMMPMVGTVMLLTFPVDKRGMAMGIFGIIIGVGPCIGPVVAGFVVDAGNWRSMFWVIAALCLVGIAFAIPMLKELGGGDASTPKLDRLSVLLSTFGFGLVLFSFSSIGSYGFTWLTMGPLAIGGVVMFLFFRRQLRLEHPMLKVDVMKSRRFTVGTIIGMIVQAAIMANSIILPIFVQDLCGYSASTSALVLLPGSIGIGVVGPIAGRIFDRRGPRGLAIFGTLVLTAFTLPMCFMSPSTNMVWLSVVMFFRNVGLGCINMPLTTWGLNSLDNKVVNHGNAVNNSLRQVAGSFGAALNISVYSIVMGANMGELGAIDAGVTGVNAAFALQTVICLVAAILSITMVREKAGDAKKTDPAGVHRQTLESIMKRDVYTVPDTATVAEAVQILTSHGISAAPVVDKDAHVVGMISDGDVIRVMGRRGRSYMDPIAMIINSEKLDPDFAHRLDEVMNAPVTSFATMNVIGVDVHDSFAEVCRVLGENHLRKAPVLDGGKLVGVVNRSDVTTYALSLYASGMLTGEPATGGVPAELAAEYAKMEAEA